MSKKTESLYGEKLTRVARGTRRESVFCKNEYLQALSASFKRSRKTPKKYISAVAQLKNLSDRINIYNKYCFK